MSKSAILINLLLFATLAFAEDRPNPKWKYGEGKSDMDDSKIVSLSLEAENEIEGWLKSYRPILHIRCQENKTEIYIITGMAANPEYGLYNEYTVRVRLDEGKPLKERWSESTDNTALFASKSIRLARQLVKAKKMLFEFIPYNSNPQTVEFALCGIENLLPDVAKACRWKL